MRVNNWGRGISVVIAAANGALLEKVRRHTTHLCLRAYVRSLEDLHRVIEEHNPEVALISDALADGPAPALARIRQLAARHSHTRPVLVLEQLERDVIVEAFAAGAKGVVGSREPVETICAGIQAVANGKICASAEVVQLFLAGIASKLEAA